MRVLLDTHIFLWATSGSTSLMAGARRAIENADALVAAIESSGFVELPVSAAHAARVARLPLLHTDPFDRLLIAQAISETLQFLTADAALRPYSDLVALA